MDPCNNSHALQERKYESLTYWEEKKWFWVGLLVGRYQIKEPSGQHLYMLHVVD